MSEAKDECAPKKGSDRRGVFCPPLPLFRGVSSGRAEEEEGTEQVAIVDKATDPLRDTDKMRRVGQEVVG